MTKFAFYASICLNVAFLLYIAQQQIKSNSLKTNVSQRFESKNIAIISPAIHPSIEKIEQNAKSVLEEKLPGCKINFFNAGGKKTLMTAQVQEVVSKKPDAVITIGAQATQLTKEAFKKRNIKTLQVFTAVSTPSRIGIEYIPNQLSGIEEKPNYKLTAETLSYLSPTTKSLLLVYNPTEGNALDQEKIALEEALQAVNIQLISLEVFQTNEVVQKTKNLITQHDGIIILKDNSVVAAVDSLVKLCEQHKKILIAHDLDSGDKGACLSFGVQESNYGIEAGEIVSRKILKPEQELAPITRVSKENIKFNTAAALQQRLELSPQLLNILKTIIVV